ncbi:hypothetical protein QG37_01076 [Candidozyma auris]|uniref:Uncharacterized protein n=1 Tax=Candidozyma auris TaxID=498019 RepID=A0A0L0P6S9_CANAR|nr:hypothetical protein QG37_01076 [[Candida] auris]
MSRDEILPVKPLVGVCWMDMVLWKKRFLMKKIKVGENTGLYTLRKRVYRCGGRMFW